MAVTQAALMVLENAGAGTGRHVIDLCAGLLQRGWQVHVAYSGGRLETGFAQELAALGDLRTVSIPMRREPGPWDLLAAYRLWQYVRQAGPFGLIHGHSSKGGALARLVGWITGVRVFYTPHALVTLDPTLGSAKRTLYVLVERMLSKLTHIVFCVSADESRHAQSIGIGAQRLLTVPNGIRALPPVERDEVRRSLGLEPSQLCFGFVGRLGHQKGIDSLLRAFAQVHQQAPDVRLAVVGDGPQAQALRAQSDQAGLQDAVIWVGHADGARMMAALDVFVLASLYEGFPYVLLEAASRELPIVMTEVGGALEMQQHAGAKVVPIDDSSALAAAMLEGVQNDQWREAAKQKSRSAAAYFSAERMVDEVITAYQRA